MSNAQFAKRLAALEKAVEELSAKVDQGITSHRRWWVTSAGRFADDPVFDEIVKLGRKYRESLRPKPKRGRRDRP
jgi:hypothetical protein